ncbi:hypothetical protein BDF19DRAFT_436360 [Syncephalis fuscata]|nr:hypothetical protein BDF19DRAFT_436360 [Syncephalis fuscata]
MRSILALATVGLFVCLASLSAADAKPNIICPLALINCDSCPEYTTCVDTPGTATTCPKRECVPKKGCKKCPRLPLVCPPCPSNTKCVIVPYNCHQCGSASCEPTY